MIHYGMTKTAQLAISRGVAESVAGTGVTVNAVLPGPTRSELLLKWLDQTSKQTGRRGASRGNVRQLIGVRRPSQVDRQRKYQENKKRVPV